MIWFMERYPSKINCSLNNKILGCPVQESMIYNIYTLSDHKEAAENHRKPCVTYNIGKLCENKQKFGPWDQLGQTRLGLGEIIGKCEQM
jgi:hypothetical protein